MNRLSARPIENLSHHSCSLPRETVLSCIVPERRPGICEAGLFTRCDGIDSSCWARMAWPASSGRVSRPSCRFSAHQWISVLAPTSRDREKATKVMLIEQQYAMMDSIGVERRILRWGMMHGRYQKPIRHVGPEFPSLLSSSARFIPIVQCAGLSLPQLSSRHMFARNRGKETVVVGMNHR